jgi:acylphosphatase
VVYGKVQGVYFRAHTQGQAVRLGLTGWVRNTPEGQVEVLACGAEERLADLRAWLRRGPALARVSELRCQSVPHQRFEGFEIR